jgi:hypothetical protein
MKWERRQAGGMDVDPVELVEMAKMRRKRLMVSFLNCDSYGWGGHCLMEIEIGTRVSFHG